MTQSGRRASISGSWQPSLTPWNRILFIRPNFFLNRFKVDKTVVFYSAWDDTKNCGGRIGSPIDTEAIVTNQQLDMMRPENAGAVRAGPGNLHRTISGVSA